jgi:hypothetical protein
VSHGGCHRGPLPAAYPHETWTGAVAILTVLLCLGGLVSARLRSMAHIGLLVPALLAALLVLDAPTAYDVAQMSVCAVITGETEAVRTLRVAVWGMVLSGATASLSSLASLFVTRRRRMG